MSEGGWPVSAQWVSDETFLGSDANGHSIVYDSGNYGFPRGMTPMNALLSSLGACTGMDVVAILKKRKQRLDALRVVLRGERPEHGYPKPFRSIEIRYVLRGIGLKKEFVEEAVNGSMEKFCSVSATLKPGVRISYSYEIEQSDVKP